jgi:uroporphyrinogen III methyltransferase/synthase
LANDQLLKYAAADAELIHVGKKPKVRCADQRKIEALLIQQARAGKYVVRLKGGDPFVFGRGGEEAQALRRAGVPFDVVPGVSAAIAAPAYAGIPLTHRACASSVAIVTGHRAVDGEGSVNWSRLAAAADTLVILMGLHNLDAIMDRLLDGGCEPERPVSLIQCGTRQSQRCLIGTVATIAELAAAARFTAPTTIVVGKVVRLAEELEWFQACRAEFQPWLSNPQPDHGTASPR